MGMMFPFILPYAHSLKHSQHLYEHFGKVSVSNLMSWLEIMKSSDLFWPLAPSWYWCGYQ